MFCLGKRLFLCRVWLFDAWRCVEEITVCSLYQGKEVSCLPCPFLDWGILRTLNNKFKADPSTQWMSSQLLSVVSDRFLSSVHTPLLWNTWTMGTDSNYGRWEEEIFGEQKLFYFQTKFSGNTMSWEVMYISLRYKFLLQKDTFQSYSGVCSFSE